MHQRRDPLAGVVVVFPLVAGFLEGYENHFGAGFLDEPVESLGKLFLPEAGVDARVPLTNRDRHARLRARPGRKKRREFVAACRGGPARERAIGCYSDRLAGDAERFDRAFRVVIANGNHVRRQTDGTGVLASLFREQRTHPDAIQHHPLAPKGRVQRDSGE